MIKQVHLIDMGFRCILMKTGSDVTEGLALTVAHHIVHMNSKGRVVICIVLKFAFDLASSDVKIHIFVIIYNWSVRHLDRASDCGFHYWCATVVIVVQLLKQSESKIVSFIFSVLISLFEVFQLSLQTFVFSLDDFEFLIVVLSSGSVVSFFLIFSISVEGPESLTLQDHCEKALRVSSGHPLKISQIQLSMLQLCRDI